jgi:hypothetical protein
VFVCVGAVYEDPIDTPYLKQALSVKVAARGQGPIIIAWLAATKALVDVDCARIIEELSRKALSNS